MFIYLFNRFIGYQWTGFNRDHIPQANNRPEQRHTDRERNEQ